VIEIKEFGIKEFTALLNPENLARAQREALQNTRGKTATLINKTVRETYVIEAGAITRRMRLGWDDGEKTEARLDWTGSKIGLINFGAQFKKVQSARGTRQGATFKMIKSKGRVLSKAGGVGGFIATGKNGNTHIFARTNPTKKVTSSKTGNPILSRDIHARTGPSIPQMVGGPQVMEAAQAFVQAEYPEQLLNKLQRFFEIQAGLR
jgi:hypothetical protein